MEGRPPLVALGMFWALNIAVAAVSTGLVAALLYVYGRNASQVRSRFSLGLLAFAVLFLVQSVAAIWFSVSMNDAGMKADVAVPMLLLNATGTGALAALVAVTWE